MKPGLMIEEEGDTVLYAQPPFTAEQWDELLDQTALTLQRWTRGRLARKRLKEMKFESLFFSCSILSFREEQERKKHENSLKTDVKSKEEDIVRVREMQRRTHPTTASDFAILQSELDGFLISLHSIFSMLLSHLSYSLPHSLDGHGNGANQFT